MTAPKRRRRRISVPPSYLVTAAVSFAAAVALAHASGLIWALLAALAATVAYLLGRQGRKPAPARKPPTEFAKRKRAAERQSVTTGAKGRGWLPPASPDLLPMMISEYCSDGKCALCPGNGCEHDCRHDPAIIVARNAAEYDEAHP